MRELAHRNRSLSSSHRFEGLAREDVYRSTQQLIWMTDVGAPVKSGICISQDEKLAILGTTEGDVICIDVCNGSERFRWRTNGEIRGTPLIVGPWCFAVRAALVARPHTTPPTLRNRQSDDVEAHDPQTQKYRQARPLCGARRSFVVWDTFATESLL
jgi:hypothetical protein